MKRRPSIPWFSGGGSRREDLSGVQRLSSSAPSRSVVSPRVPSHLPSHSADAIEVNEESLAQSFAILDVEGRVIGAASNETMPPFDVDPPFREYDPFLDTVVSVWEPVYGALGAMDSGGMFYVIRLA